MSQPSRLLRLAALASQAVNVLVFDGHTDETVSGRAHREGFVGGDPVWRKRRDVLNRLFFRQSDHCAASHAADVDFAKNILREERCSLPER